MAKNTDKPSPEYVQSVLRYDEETGYFFRKKAVSHVAAWAKAGTVNCITGYVYIGINGVQYLAHRLAFVIKTGDWPTHEVDHISGDPSDNRWCNLRPATHQQNACNKQETKNSTGFKGIYVSGNRWKAAIKQNRKRYYLGCFITKEDAYFAYCEAAKRLHGEFASFD